MNKHDEKREGLAWAGVFLFVLCFCRVQWRRWGDISFVAQSLVCIATFVDVFVTLLLSLDEDKKCGCLVGWMSLVY